MDEQVVRLAPEIRGVADKYVRLRLSNMRGLDLGVFDFDYDLNWMALLLSPEGVVLGRFGGREAASADRFRTLSGLKHVLEAGLERFGALGAEKPRKSTPRRAEDLAAARGHRGCIHCHHVHEFQRADAKENGTWTPALEHRYPDPATVGLELDPAMGHRILAVAPGSLAEGAGIRAGDVLTRVEGMRVSSFADVQFALDRAPSEGALTLTLRRAMKEHTTALRLPAAWKERTDISWRWSLTSLKPDPPVSGIDLTVEEKNAHGLDPARMAFRQGPFLSPAARHAGVQIGDIIVGVGDVDWPSRARQFEAQFRLRFHASREVAVDLLRGKERRRVTVQLP